MALGTEDDVLWLPPAWSLEHKRAASETQLQNIWDIHSEPYSRAISNQGIWTSGLKTGDWAMEDWLVENLFLQGHIGLLVGDAGTGKSLMGLDLMISMVSGGKWLGHYESFVSPVVYFAGEGKIAENNNHILGLLLGRGEHVGDFVRQYGNRIQLHAPDSSRYGANAPLSSDAWWENIEALVNSTLPKEARPKLWIFDPLLALIDSTDKADSVRPFIARCRWLAEQTGGYSLVIHHPNKKAGSSQPTSHAEKIRGESMFRNLFDDVLYLEQDTENPNMAHLYANKLKRGVADDARPMCHVIRTFNDISEATFYRTLEQAGVTRTGRESPQSLKQITLRYLPYSQELHKKGSDDEPADVEPRQEKGRTKDAPLVSPSNGNGTTREGWDQDHNRVWNVLALADEPLSIHRIQQALAVDGNPPISTSKVQARIDTLENQNLLVRTSTNLGAEGRPGIRYTLRSKNP